MITENYGKINSQNPTMRSAVSRDDQFKQAPKNVVLAAHHSATLLAALKYAERGWHVFPVHVPIFNDAGKNVGCTCEEWKRTQARYGPDYKCPQPGKCPAVRWADKATTDPEQIQKWWGHKWTGANVETGSAIYYTPNIGIACGPSGLLAFDADAYKETYGGDDLLSLADKQTITNLTGGGGEHLIYAMPKGKLYGNAKGELPPGIDIRGAGGYIVVPPSLHKSGRRYQFEDGYNPGEIELKPIPEALQAILDNAQDQSMGAQVVTFTTPSTEEPQLGQWRLSKAIKHLIFNPAPSGERSEADMKVVTSLCYAGATDDQILAVFEHYPIGVNGKFAESGRGYLARTIGRARVFVEAHPRPNARATVGVLRLWNRTHDIAAHVPAGPGRRCLRKVVDSWCDLAEKDERLIVNAGKKLLAKLAGVDAKSVKNALTLLNGVLFDVAPGEHGSHIALVDNCRLQQLHPALSVVTGEDKRGEVSENDKNFYSPHKADDAFATGVSRYVKQQLEKVATVLNDSAAGDYTPVISLKWVRKHYTKPGLGEGVLLAFDTAARLGGDMTAQEYAAEAGIKLSAARAHLRRCEQRELADSYRESSRGPKVYSFLPDFWTRIEAMTPDLSTYKLSAQRENKRLEGAQQWAKAEQKKAENAGDTEKAQKLERRVNHLAKERLSHLERLHPDLSAKEIECLAYEVAAYKRSAEREAVVRSARRMAQEEHELTVVRIVQCLTSYAGGYGTLPAMPTRPTHEEKARGDTTITIEGQTFERAMVADVMRNPALVKRTLQGVEEVYAGAKVSA